MSNQQTVRVKVPMFSCISNQDKTEIPFESLMFEFKEPLDGYDYFHSAWDLWTRTLPAKERQRKRRALARIARLAQ